MMIAPFPTETPKSFGWASLFFWLPPLPGSSRRRPRADFASDRSALGAYWLGPGETSRVLGQSSKRRTATFRSTSLARRLTLLLPSFHPEIGKGPKAAYSPAGIE